MKIQYRLHIFGNVLALFFICIILIVALKEQLWDKCLPCPLCFLQRAAYIAGGLALALNLSRGPKPQHYGLFILACLMGMGIAVRQELLHIMPGDHGYGAPVAGLCAYTWNIIIFFSFIVVSGLALFFSGGFLEPFHRFGPISKIGVICLLVLIATSILSALFICGIHKCPDNPVKYIIFN